MDRKEKTLKALQAAVGDEEAGLVVDLMQNVDKDTLRAIVERAKTLQASETVSGDGHQEDGKLVVRPSADAELKITEWLLYGDKKDLLRLIETSEIPSGAILDFVCLWTLDDISEYDFNDDAIKVLLRNLMIAMIGRDRKRAKEAIKMFSLEQAEEEGEMPKGGPLF